MHHYLKITSIAQSIIKPCLSQAKVVIDATVGNGYDTMFLAKNTSPDVSIYGFDIAKEALSITSKKLKTANLLHKVTLYLENHSCIGQVVGHISIDAAMFNLGYLPGASKECITKPDSTVSAISCVLERLSRGGIVSICVYEGHVGALDESRAIKRFISQLPKDKYLVGQYNTLLETRYPNYLIIVEKKK